MSATDTMTEGKPARPPVLGERARAALALSLEGEKRRRVLTLLGAFADGNDGQCSPSTDLMLERIPSITSAGKLWGVLRRLQEDGYLRQLPKGAGFELLYLDPDNGSDGEQVAVKE